MTEQAKLFYETFQNNAAGEKVFQLLCQRFYDISSYQRGDPHHTSYVEGQREVMAFIINQINLSQQEPIGEQEDGPF